MVKKISAVLLALILCLSMIVVPASAAVELDEANLAFALEWDKEYYSAGDTAKLSVYIDVADDYSLYTGSFIIGLNSAQISQADNVIDDVKTSATTNDTFRSYFKGADTQLTWLATSVASKVTAANTAEEQALYDHYLKYTGSKDLAGGTHENTGTNKAGFNGSDFDPSIPVMTISFVVAADVADGTVLNAAITSGSLTCSPVQTTWKYYKTPGSATTTANIAVENIDVSQAVATATVGAEPCENHTWDDGVVTTEPTCGEAGVKTYTCSVCKSTKTEDVAATGNHTAGEAVKENEVPASCSVAGSYDSVVYCSACGTEMSRTAEVVEATGEHVYATEQSRVEATCTTPGSVTMACGCGATQVTETPATGHTEVEIPAVEATCTTDGASAGVKCSVCEEILTAPTTVPSAGHTEKTVVENEVPATCTDDGSYESVVVCTVCETEISRETVPVPATGHTYGEGKQTKSPTCEKAGETRYTCEACGYVDKRAEPAALGHVEVVIPAVAPTCLNPGFTEGTQCTTCNSYVVPREKIPALGHTKTNGVVTEPTYSSKGYTTYVCDTCGVEYKDDYVDMLAIDFKAEIKEPSITEIRCKDTIVLNAVKTNGEELPDDVTVVWTADNENFKTNEINGGKSLEITSKNKGYTVFTVTVYDARGYVISTDTVEMYSNAGFFAKIGGFFRTIFGLTKYYEY